MLRLLDTFSGIGGFSLAARWVGDFQTVQFVEREPYCQRILAKHWPDVPIHDDICTFQPAPGSADVICGGFPCQDISTAGSQAGIKVGTRSGLFYELMRVIRMVGPRFVVLENVAAITSGGLDIVLGELAEAGFDAEWACIPASAVGACHRRDRWWLVAYPNRGDGQSKQITGSAIHEQARFQGPDGDACRTDEVSRNGAPAYPTHMLSDGGTSEQHGQSGRRSVPELGDGGGADAPNPNHPRLERRQPASMSERGGERLAWHGDPPSGRLNPNWRSYVSEPCLRRGNDGLSGRVDRLKGLGNAVVPQVAMIPLARVLELATTAAE